MMRVRVNAHGKPGPSDAQRCSWCGHGVHEAQRDDEVETLVRIARQGETDPAKLFESVSVDFRDLGGVKFDGQSYGLALAIADRMARYRETGGQERRGGSKHERSIVATGCLTESGGEMRVGEVDEFSAKLSGLRKSLDEGRLGPGDEFFYPRDNAESLGEADRRLLQVLEQGGLKCRAIDRLPDFVHKGRSTPEPKCKPGAPPPQPREGPGAVPHPTRRWWERWMVDSQLHLPLFGLLTILAAILVAVFGYLFLTRNG